MVPFLPAHNPSLFSHSCVYVIFFARAQLSPALKKLWGGTIGLKDTFPSTVIFSVPVALPAELQQYREASVAWQKGADKDKADKAPKFPEDAKDKNKFKNAAALLAVDKPNIKMTVSLPRERDPAVTCALCSALFCSALRVCMCVYVCMCFPFHCLEAGE